MVQFLGVAGRQRAGGVYSGQRVWAHMGRVEQRRAKHCGRRFLPASFAAHISFVHHDPFDHSGSLVDCTGKSIHTCIPKDALESDGASIYRFALLLHQPVLVVHLVDHPAVCGFSVSFPSHAAVRREEFPDHHPGIYICFAVFRDSWCAIFAQSLLLDDRYFFWNQAGRVHGRHGCCRMAFGIAEGRQKHAAGWESAGVVTRRLLDWSGMFLHLAGHHCIESAGDDRSVWAVLCLMAGELSKRSLSWHGFVTWIGVEAYSVFLLHQTPLKWTRIIYNQYLHLIFAFLVIALSFPAGWLINRCVAEAQKNWTLLKDKFPTKTRWLDRGRSGGCRPPDCGAQTLG